MGDRATEVALFRYALIRQAADPAISRAERGRLVRQLAARTHTGPGGVEVRVGRSTADEWIRAWRSGGFEALKPSPRACTPRVPGDTLALAEALKREAPDRTAAHICQILAAAAGWAPNPRTIQRHFRRIGLTRRSLSAAKVAFGRFEAFRPNELWVGDALHGPVVRRHKAILFAFLDDHSRLVCGSRWVTAEDTLRAEAALRAGLAARGVPQALYLDNGSPFISAQLLRACASLGIRLVHSRPGRPEGRGKIERFLCATRRPVASPAEPGGTRREVLGSDGFTRTRKGKGDKSMPGNHGSGRGVWGEAMGDPRDMAKAGLLEAQSPEGESSHPPERRPKPAPALRPAWKQRCATSGARSDAQ